MRSFISWLSADNQKSTEQDEIKPILFDKRFLTLDKRNSKEDRADEEEIDKLETYYYRNLDLKRLGELMFEKCPKGKAALDIEYYENKKDELILLEKALSRKLTKIAASEYGNFCKSLLMVQDIGVNIEDQSRNIAEQRQILATKKIDFCMKVLEVGRKQKLKKKKIEKLRRLEFIEKEFGSLIRSFKKLDNGKYVNDIVSFLDETNKFNKGKEEKKKRLIELDDELVPIYKKIEKIAEIGMKKCDGILNDLFKESVIADDGIVLYDLIKMTREKEKEGFFQQNRSEGMMKDYIVNTIKKLVRDTMMEITESDTLNLTQQNSLRGKLERNPDRIFKMIKELDYAMLKLFVPGVLKKIDNFRLFFEPKLTASEDKDLLVLWNSYLKFYFNRILSGINENGLVKMSPFDFITLDKRVEKSLSQIEGIDLVLASWEEKCQSSLKKCVVINLMALLKNFSNINAELMILMIPRRELIPNLEGLRHLQKEGETQYVKKVLDILGDEGALMTDRLVFFLKNYFAMISIKKHVKEKRDQFNKTFDDSESETKESLLKLKRLRDENFELIDHYTTLFLELFVVYYAQLLMLPGTKRRLVTQNKELVLDESKDLWTNQSFKAQIRFKELYGNLAAVFDEFLVEDNPFDNKESRNIKKHCVNILVKKNQYDFQPDNFASRENITLIFHQLLMFQSLLPVLDNGNDKKITILAKSIDEVLRFSYAYYFNLHEYFSILVRNTSKRTFQPEEKKEYLIFLIEQVKSYQNELTFICKGCINKQFASKMLEFYKETVLDLFSTYIQKMILQSNFSVNSLEERFKDYSILKTQITISPSSVNGKLIEKILELRKIVVDSFGKEVEFAGLFLRCYNGGNFDFINKFKNRFLTVWLKKNPGELMKMAKVTFLE